MTEPIRKSIEVGCAATEAFRIFIEDMAGWWPLDRHTVSAMSGKVARGIELEPRLGGKMHEIAHDGARHLWGTVLSYEPGVSFAMTWHAGLPENDATRLELAFEEIAPARTRVSLVHSEWERLGADADTMRNGYDQGWVGVFETAYAGACRASAA